MVQFFTAVKKFLPTRVPGQRSILYVILFDSLLVLVD